MKERYYLYEERPKGDNAGSKAVDDCDAILSRLNFKGIKVYSGNRSNKLVREADRLFRYYHLYDLPKRSTLVIRHPIYYKINYFPLLRQLKKKCQLTLTFSYS